MWLNLNHHRLGRVHALGLETTLFLRKEFLAKGYIPEASRFGKTGKRGKQFRREKQVPGEERGPWPRGPALPCMQQGVAPGGRAALVLVPAPTHTLTPGPRLAAPTGTRNSLWWGEGLRSLGFKPGLRSGAEGGSQNQTHKATRGTEFPRTHQGSHNLVAHWSLEWSQTCMVREANKPEISFCFLVEVYKALSFLLWFQVSISEQYFLTFKTGLSEIQLVES